jgi:hypothetical protein
MHFTSRHVNWLNVGEIELSVLGRQCCARRIDDLDRLKLELAAWQKGGSGGEETVK